MREYLAREVSEVISYWGIAESDGGSDNSSFFAGTHRFDGLELDQLALVL